MINASCPLSLLSSAVHHWNASEVEHELEQHLGSSILLASVLLIISLFVLIAGAKLVKPTLFTVSFGLATIGAFIAFDAALPLAPNLSSNISCILLGAGPLGVGLIAGLLALCLLQLGFFMLGAGAGCGLGYTLYAAGLDTIPSPPAFGQYDLSLVLCLSIGAMLGALLMCKFKKDLMIGCTSAAGAAGSTLAIALLLAHVNIKFTSATSTSPYRWVQPIVAVCLFCLGLCVQCRSARKSREHEYATHLRPAQVPLMNP